MWDYNKLFAEGNIVGFKHSDENQIRPYIIYEQNDCMDYFNSSLSYNGRDFTSQIQYIIRLDKHGNVIEKLFDRDRDMKPEHKPMPDLKTGMFVRMADRANWRDNTIAYVDHQNNRLVAKEGWFEALSRKDEWQYLRIVEVFSKNVCCFD